MSHAMSHAERLLELTGLGEGNRWDMATSPKDETP